MAGAAVRLSVKVIPNAGRNEVVGWRGEELTVKLSAAPVKGRANRDLIAFLADIFAVPRDDVHLLQGESSRHKVVQIAGISAGQARERLGPHLR
ncbi:MAG: DUF167 domain-containing protein [Armatimonadota bacterium]